MKSKFVTSKGSHDSIFGALLKRMFAIYAIASYAIFREFYQIMSFIEIVLPAQ